MNGWDVNVDTPMRDLLEWCCQEKGVDRLLLSALVKRRAKSTLLAKPQVGKLTEETFADKILDRKLALKWPGTERYEEPGLIYVIDFDASLIEPMVRLGPLLACWHHSNTLPLPEDPCLFRQGDEWPVLISVTHERDAWILSDERPPFCSGEPFVFKPDNLLVPPASEGFVGP